MVNPQFHGFSDAGKLGHGGALFLRWKVSDAEFTSTFAAAKPLGAPLKKKILPKLELMGCALLSRLAAKVEQSLKIEVEETLWCASTTACYR